MVENVEITEEEKAITHHSSSENESLNITKGVKRNHTGNSVIMACSIKNVIVVDVHQLASVVRNSIDRVLIIDSRSFLEFNTCHIIGAVNVYCSKIVKRRLQQDKVSIKELLIHTCQWEVDESYDVVVYDQGSLDVAAIPSDSFVAVLLKKLLPVFRSVNLVKGGFLEFQAAYPNLCEDKTRKCMPLTSLSQPCLPITNQGPTRILPFLYLGSQQDALNQELLKNYTITYELNVSTTCPKPDFIQDAHFMRIPVNDNYSEKLLPHFPKSFQFLDKVRQASGRVLVHCLAGISRSPTIAIAYVMRHLKMTSDDAYRYVKSKRPTISPNFNFLGQLLEYEKQLRKDKVLDPKPEVSSAPPLSGSKKRLCMSDMRACRNLTLNIHKPTLDPVSSTPPDSNSPQVITKSGDQSPTTALAKLSFSVAEDNNENLDGNSSPRLTVPSSFTANKRHDYVRSYSMSYADEWLGKTGTSGRKVEETIKASNPSNIITTESNGKASPSPRMALGETSEALPHDGDNGKENNTEEATMDNTKSNESVLKSIPWNVESLPISSLKELFFTPCLTSLSSPTSETVKPLSKLLSFSAEISSTTETVTVSSSCTVKNEFTSKTCLLQQKVIESSVGDRNSATANVGSTSWCSALPLSPSAPLTADSVIGSCGNTDRFSRSDSVCTSGLGSEASESSLGDCFPSMEGGFECDLDDAVFKKPIPSPLNTTSSWDGSRKSLDRAQHLLGIKSPTAPGSSKSMMMTAETLQSPVSPSEQHLMEDFDDLEQLQENFPRQSAGFTLWQKPSQQSLQPMDSGILSPSFAEGQDAKSFTPTSLDSYTVKGSRTMYEDAAVVTINSRKNVLSEMPSHNLLPTSSTSKKCEMKTTVKEQLGPSSGSGSGFDLTEGNFCPWLRRSSVEKATTPDGESQPFGKSATALKNDGLYRAQSCPGIVGWFRTTTTPSSSGSDKFKMPLASGQYQMGSSNDWDAPKLRKRSTTQAADRASKYRNRYSCGSLDYTHHHPSSEAFGYESCPDALHFGGGTCCHQKSSSPSTPDSGSSLSPSHRVFRQSVSMIQVS